MQISYGSLEKTHHDYARDMVVVFINGELEYNPPLSMV